jgi:DNA-binding transcriptional LysR family regulator
MQEFEPSLRALRLFQMIGEGGLVKAAERMGMSQSAASHAIGVLERATGAKLLVRGRGQLRFSNTAERLLPHIRQMLQALEAIREELAAEAGVQRGFLRVAAVPTVASSVIPALLREFAKRYPGIDVTLLEGTDHEVAEWVRHKVSHCGFAALPVAGLDGYPIGKDEWTILVPKREFEGQVQVRLAELRGRRLLLSGGGCEDHILHLFHQARVALPDHLVVRQMDTIHAMVAEELGVSVVPSLALARRPKNVRVLKLSPRRFRTIGLLLPPKLIRSPALERWVDLVTAVCPEILKRVSGW